MTNKDTIKRVTHPKRSRLSTVEQQEQSGRTDQNLTHSVRKQFRAIIRNLLRNVDIFHHNLGHPFRETKNSAKWHEWTMKGVGIKFNFDTHAAWDFLLISINLSYSA